MINLLTCSNGCKFNLIDRGS